MITTISMKNFAVYKEKTELSHCKKINLVYGNNGTGKTILSNFLSDSSLPEYKDCSITWENNKPLPVFVFNKKFCDNNFLSSDIPGIFTLGQGNVEIENKTDAIENKINFQKHEFERLQNEFRLLNQRKKEQQDICIEALWDRAKTYKQLFPNYFPKSYTKAQLFEKTLSGFDNLTHVTTDLLKLKQRADVLNSQKEAQYAFYPLFDESQPVSIEEHSIWNEYLQDEMKTGSALNNKDRKLAEWLHQGAQFLAEGSNVCPFCEQEIPPMDFERINHLSPDYYTQKINKCDQLLSQYETVVKKILYTADRILKQNRDEGAPFLDTGKFAETVTNLRNLFHTNILFMQRKRDSFSQQVHIQSCSNLVSELNELIDESNQQADQANVLLNNIKKNKAELKKEVWISFCENSDKDIWRYKNAVYQNEPKMNSIIKEIDQINLTIKNLECEKEVVLRNSVNIRESVDRINNELHSLRISNFHLQVSKDSRHYNILRENGEAASETLSEGEKTLIMLLYFLQMAEGAPTADVVRTERIVVIDDPVSNLDDNMLNAVLERIGLLITIILDGDKNIQQLFLLTHRKECTKKLRICDKRLENEQNIGLWILKKRNGMSQTQIFTTVM